MLYLDKDSIDVWCLESIPNFEGKNFQNVANDGAQLDKSKAGEERAKELEKTNVKWLKTLLRCRVKVLLRKMWFLFFGPIFIF